MKKKPQIISHKGSQKCTEKPLSSEPCGVCARSFGRHLRCVSDGFSITPGAWQRHHPERVSAAAVDGEACRLAHQLR